MEIIWYIFRFDKDMKLIEDKRFNCCSLNFCLFGKNLSYPSKPSDTHEPNVYLKYGQRMFQVTGIIVREFPRFKSTFHNN